MCAMRTAGFNGTEQTRWANWGTHDGTAIKWLRGGWLSQQVFPNVVCVFFWGGSLRGKGSARFIVPRAISPMGIY